MWQRLVDQLKSVTGQDYPDLLESIEMGGASDNGDLSGVCLCGKTGCRYIFDFSCKTNGATFDLGSCCVKQLRNQLPQEADASLRQVAEEIVIDHDNLMQQLTHKQCEWCGKHKIKLIFFFKQKTAYDICKDCMR